MQFPKLVKDNQLKTKNNSPAELFSLKAMSQLNDKIVDACRREKSIASL